MDTNDISEKAQEWQSKAEDTQEALREKAQQFQEAAQDWTERFKGSARSAASQADSYLHENAWTSVALVAIVAGFLGYLLGRGRD